MQLSLLDLDQKNARLRKLNRRASKAGLAIYEEQLRLCWIFHDHALEGIVLGEEELSRGVRNEHGRDVCQDVILHGIHRLYHAIGEIRRMVDEDEIVFDLNTIKRMHQLVTTVGDERAGRYRKVEGPLGAYLHDAPPPRNISYRLRKLVESIETDLPRLHPVRAASYVHLHLMQIFPFDGLTGRAGRLALNLWLMNEGYPPVIISAGDRASYYNALCKQGPAALTELIVDALHNTIDKGIAACEQAGSVRASSWAQRA